MAIPSRQIGWSTTDNLLWEISKQVEGLGCTIACGTSAGSSGTSGISGSSGTSGATFGTSGTSGEAGTAGTSGLAGSSGTTGLSGTSGVSGASSLYYGSFYSSTTQQATVPNVKQAVMFENTVFAQGVSIQQDIDGYYTKITFANAGKYNIAFSGQLHHLGGGGSGQDIYMWFRQNGIDIPDSNTRLTVTTNSPYIVAAWNIFVDVQAGDNIQLVGYPTSTSIILQASPATGTQPAIPSVILTVNQIG